MGIIQVLDENLASQIAAGEVVERPASVIKELLENALDAGARRVDVHLEGGGIERMSVRDDGHGMSAEDAPLCFARHATSKLKDIDELRRIGTFGFRGEALAAISSVSRVTLKTRPADEPAAFEVRVDGGNIEYVGDGAAPFGTHLDIRDLFFNVPARRKFLKSPRTEAGHVEQVVRTAALGQPDVAFRLSHEGKTLLDVPEAPLDAPLEHPRRIERAVQCLGKQVRDMLFPFEAATDSLRLSGYVVAPLETRRDFAGVHLSVNGRPVSDRGLSQAVRVAYRTLLEVGRQPILALNMEMDPEWVDVNVHPRKAEVRFSEPRVVQGHLIRLLSDFLSSTPWLSQTSQGRKYTLQAPAASAGESQAAAAVAPELQVASHMRHPPASPATLASANAGIEGQTSEPTADDPSEVHRQRVRQALERFRARKDPGDTQGGATGPAHLSRMGGGRATASARPQPKTVQPAGALETSPGLLRAERFSELRVVGQTGATYLLLEGPDGLVVIDQHAAHERVVFERLREAAASGTPRSQPLLFPMTVNLGPLESAALEEHTQVLLSYGIEMEAFGEGTALLRAVPAGLDGGQAEAIAKDALAELADDGRADSLEELRDRICAKLACHGSVRAGQTLSAEEIRALLRSLDAIDLGAHCPHGRPVVRTVRHDDMAKWFDRE